MRALVARHLNGPGAAELIDTPIPVPAAGQVRAVGSSPAGTPGRRC